MKKIKFNYVWQLQLAIDLFINQWLENNHLDPDLEFEIRATEWVSGYVLEVSYNTRLGSYNGSDIGPQDDGERETDQILFDFANTDRALERTVTEILEKVSQIKVAA